MVQVDYLFSHNNGVNAARLGQTDTLKLLFKRRAIRKEGRFERKYRYHYEKIPLYRLSSDSLSLPPDDPIIGYVFEPRCGFALRGGSLSKK